MIRLDFVCLALPQGKSYLKRMTCPLSNLLPVLWILSLTLAVFVIGIEDDYKRSKGGGVGEGRRGGQVIDIKGRGIHESMDQKESSAYCVRSTQAVHSLLEQEAKLISHVSKLLVLAQNTNGIDYSRINDLQR